MAKRYILQQVSEGTNRNLSPRNKPVQLLALYTDPESHNAQRYRQTDGQTDDRMMPIADHTVPVRSAKTQPLHRWPVYKTSDPIYSTEKNGNCCVVEAALFVFNTGPDSPYTLAIADDKNPHCNNTKW